MRPQTRARLIGAVVLIVVFAAGVAAGLAWPRLSPRSGAVNVDVRLSTELPRELTRLGLDAAQEDSLRAVLVRGNTRVQRLLGEFEPRMRATLDSIDADVAAQLTEEQRARLRASRPARADEMEVDTTRRQR